MKSAAMPSCLEGGDTGKNITYWIDHNLKLRYG